MKAAGASAFANLSHPTNGVVKAREPRYSLATQLMAVRMRERMEKNPPSVFLHSNQSNQISSKVAIKVPFDYFEIILEYLLYNHVI